jgi:MtN3 and saliva related transmembrane protein
VRDGTSENSSVRASGVYVSEQKRRPFELSMSAAAFVSLWERRIRVDDLSEAQHSAVSALDELWADDLPPWLDRWQGGFGGILGAIVMSLKATDIVGWVSTAILLATIARQVFTQWKSKSTSGVSKWLFVGQITASIGYTTYSYLLHNWVFLVSNIAIVVTAVIGEAIFLSNRHRRRSP